MTQVARQQSIGPDGPSCTLATTSTPDVPSPAHATHLLKGLDNVAHGIALFDRQCRVLYANAAARALLARCRGTNLGTTAWSQWQCIVARVCDRSRRELVRLPGASTPLFAALVPVGPAEQPLAFTTFAREDLCGTIELQMFASHHGLTPAESHVLVQLCRGLNSGQIAREHGVAPTTVLTQIAAIRAKTAASSIRQLLDALSRMPPLTPLSSLSSPIATP